MKNSDSDYKAEDQGSASDVGTIKKGKVGVKKPFSLKLTKKEIIEKALKDFLPEGTQLLGQNQVSEEDYKQLQEIESAEQFSLNFKIFIGKVVHVTDGDTVKIAIKLNGKMTRFTFRLNGIDTPETRKGDAKQFGKYVKDVAKEMLMGKIVRVEAGKFDKYGRVLSRIYIFSEGQEFCFNDFLIENDMAKAYMGKTKNQFVKKDWQQFREKYDDKTWPVIQNYPLETFNKKNKDKKQ